MKLRSFPLSMVKSLMTKSTFKSVQLEVKHHYCSCLIRSLNSTPSITDREYVKRHFPTHFANMSMMSTVPILVPLKKPLASKIYQTRDLSRRPSSTCCERNQLLFRPSSAKVSLGTRESEPNIQWEQGSPTGFLTFIHLSWLY